MSVWPRSENISNMNSKIHIAVVVSESNLGPDSSYSETYNAISSAIASDKRYSEAKSSIVAWDKPRDWTIFSHILLSSGITYSHCQQEFLDWMNGLPEEQQRRMFNPPSIINWNIDKIYLLDFQKNGIRIPPTVFLQPGESLNLQQVVDKLQQQMNEPVLDTIVIKNKVDAGGHSVHLASVKNPQEAEEALKKAVRLFSNSGVIIQQFFPAIKTEGEWSLIYFGRKLSHAVLKTPSPDGFKVQGRYGGSNTPIEKTKIPKDVVSFADEVIDATKGDKLLYARVDIVRSPSGAPCLMELEAFEPFLYISQKITASDFLEKLLSY